MKNNGGSSHEAYPYTAARPRVYFKSKPCLWTASPIAKYTGRPGRTPEGGLRSDAESMTAASNAELSSVCPPCAPIKP